MPLLSSNCTILLFEAVSKNSVPKLQFAIRTYSKIQLMTSMAQCNEEGETPLLIAIKKRNWSLTHEFLAIFKKFNCEPQSMPPMCFFSIDQLSSQIQITELIDFLINDITDENWLIFFKSCLTINE